MITWDQLRWTRANKFLVKRTQHIHLSLSRTLMIEREPYATPGGNIYSFWVKPLLGTWELKHTETEVAVAACRLVEMQATGSAA